MRLQKKCPNCGNTLATLYYREYKERKAKWIAIKELYCKKCKTPTKLVELNWFKD